MKGSVFLISATTNGSLVICPPKMPIATAANAVTVAEMLSVHFKSCLMVGMAAFRSNVGRDFAMAVAVVVMPTIPESAKGFGLVLKPSNLPIQGVN